jgi:diguanylate cyclase (GGDEF)-like protein
MVLFASEKKVNFCVFYIDVDDFKRINDSLGHSFGDRFLIEVAKSLKNSCRETDYLARVGGDEFVIISGFYNDKDFPDQMVNRIFKSFSHPVSIDEIIIHSGLSIGLAVYPVAGVTGELLLKNADTAMYRAKKNGKNKYEYYTTDLDSMMQRRLAIENSLRVALENNELRVVYQPILNLETKEMVGFESLLRWESNKLGCVSPDEFIPIAERTGLVLSFTDWLIDTVFYEFSKWKLSDSQAKLQMLAVNLSVLQFSQNDLVDTVSSFCNKYEISPENVVLEITETALMNNMKRVERTICGLRKKGFCVAIDDFGTGYSSLTALRELPITHLKIDQSFIQGVHNKSNQAIINTLLRLGEWMNIVVIAEGIESEDQLHYLKNKGCKLAQGFCLKKPMEANEVMAYWQKERELERFSQ